MIRPSSTPPPDLARRHTCGYAQTWFLAPGRQVRNAALWPQSRTVAVPVRRHAKHHCDTGRLPTRQRVRHGQGPAIGRSAAAQVNTAEAGLFVDIHTGEG
ncbi:hypothetical protein RIF23_10795 [Lipingzhangella sp. LS1_29]|uniref:Uncharacterized protein n=1 Tax=Lipingzhangella rawalii TaxID=2055835 RepID=A0ABU2H660_9ACTN|nr:hypothetical protein [Lipingzhangella rawalii]MDS1270788.1 hypothetical protein [Lipingzhangella rawalii]